MPDLPIAEAFDELIRKQVVRIRVQPIDFYGAEVLGTGCISGCVKNPNWGNMAFVVTCRHLLKHPKGKRIRVEVAREGIDRKKRRSVIFETDPGSHEGPKAFWHKEDPPVDLGAIVLPARCVDGSPFLTDAEAEQETVCGVPMMPRKLLLGEGTRVAWAGYPNVARLLFLEDVLCYYEGVVAHCRNDPEAPLYLLDGHNDRGVSGGPVWCWSDKSSQIQLVGVVTAYSQAPGMGEIDLPGFTVATAINPFRALIEDVWLGQARKGAP